MVDELPELHEHSGEAVSAVIVGVQDAADQSGAGQSPSPHAQRSGGFSTCTSRLAGI